MSRSSVAASHRRLAAAIVLALLALLAALPGGALAQDPGPEDTPPIVSNASVSPSSLPFEGGQVTISIDVLDDLGVAMVYADVFESGGSGQSVQLFPSVIHPSGWITYSGSGVIGPNYSDTTVSYGVVVQAWDTNGATASAVAGEINVDAQPQFDEPPTVADPTVDPRDLGSAGGPVTIAVTAYDLRGISEAYATISPAAGATSYVPLDPISSSRFQGVLNVPANTGTAAVQYAIEITALDDIGQPASVDAGLVTVAAPSPVAQARLRLSPANLSFGAVQVGRQARRWFVLRNPGRRSSPPISGVIVAPHPAFVVVGAEPQGDMPFRLRGGEIKLFSVAFRPASAGRYQGSAAVQRADGRQPGLALRLSGRGVRRR